ncbi:hypothetical protein OCU04_002340 [Sclerotinia nivalis]|uniref:Uncharacterized protein n=1 Tax=Sclerotinia nivalis TaxID=352851 RepID=A0A9X0AWV0_9HELO|nr:hypothetical protein OCU04_002340 [Sclerotinia nivalis]
MAVILLFIYALYLFFEVKTHAADFMEPSRKAEMRSSRGRLPRGALQKELARAGAIGAAIGRAHLPERPPQ